MELTNHFGENISASFRYFGRFLFVSIFEIQIGFMCFRLLYVYCLFFADCVLIIVPGVLFKKHFKGFLAGFATTEITISKKSSVNVWFQFVYDFD